jgi:hypothetical protein
MNLARWLAVYREADLLAAYPEVRREVGERPEWFRGAERHKILYACHAVSEAGRNALSSQVRVWLDRVERTRAGTQ